MAVRLGNVIYWASCGLAGLALIIILGIGIQEPRLGPGPFIAAPVIAFAIWLVGRAFRYVLAGR
jgi:hypothetical protein